MAGCSFEKREKTGLRGVISVKRCNRRSWSRVPGFDGCEERTLSTLVFVLNGNAFDTAKPNALTADAAAVLQKAGDQALQLTTPVMATPGAFQSVVDQIKHLSHGKPIGIVGFSAGGSLAVRLAGAPGLNVAAALDYYGPPDLQDWLSFHRGDRFYDYVVSRVPFTRGIIDLLSGPSTTSADVVGAFGLHDHNVVASLSAAGLNKDYPQGHLYFYPGPHGVSITASRPALNDFLAHL
jgi:dienelactone hydrolase